MKLKNTIAIIPARGGSQRLPDKNILPIGGKPMIWHSIAYARAHGIEKIVVSTDHQEIAKLSVAYGAEVIKRPKELATAYSPTIDTLIHVLSQVEDSYTTVVLLQPTNPLRPSNMLVEGLKRFEEGHYDSLMTVTRNHQKFGKITDQGFVPYNYKIGQRSQDLEPLYFENGLLYISKSNIIKNGAIIGPYHLPFIIEHPYAHVDIDTQEDFDYANYLYSKNTP